MILKGVNNQKVELKIDGYQFPEQNKSQDESLSWLNIYVNVHSSFGNWEILDPSLTTTEFSELIKWFKDLSLNIKPGDSSLYFTEPNLEFTLLGSTLDLKNIRLIFNAESKPKLANEGQDYYVDFAFTNDELSKIADGLEVELKKYK